MLPLVLLLTLAVPDAGVDDAPWLEQRDAGPVVCMTEAY